MERLATVMVIGGGGREHALVHKYLQSPQVGRVIAVPGNPYMRVGYPEGKVTTFQYFGNKKLSTKDIPEILTIWENEKVDLVDVAQDDAVAAGLVDRIRGKGGLAVGPTRAAGEIEWSKMFERQMGDMVGMPHPFWTYFLDELPGQQFMDGQPERSWFIKYNGLAAGKGALPARNNAEAKRSIAQIVREFGIPYLVEEWIKNDDGSEGEEFSAFAFFAGDKYQYVGDAQAHKRVFEHDAPDQGENTGGMGCSGPPLVMTDERRDLVKKEIFDRVPALLSETNPYTGVLYLGGIWVTRNGMFTPLVVEFNARWGDPEAQIILPSIKNDWFEVNYAAAKGDIRGLNIERDDRYRVVVAGAARGYPGDYKNVTGKEIKGLDEARKLDGVQVYGAGIRVEDGRYFANGGRLFYIVGEGKDVFEARNRANYAMDRVSIEDNGRHFRRDIGYRDVERLTRAS